MTPVEHLLERLLRFTSFRPRSEYEIKCWLLRKKISEKDSETAIKQLKTAGVINDESFSLWWVDQRSTFRPKARRALVFELVKKGVNKTLAEEVVGKGEASDEDLAFQLIEKKKRLWEKLDAETRKKKIINLLASRGFGWEVIKRLSKEN